MSDAEKKFHDIIASHGWHVMQVRNRSDESGPTFSYSTGLWKTFRHPEFIIFGLSTDVEGALINQAGADIKAGKRRFEANTTYDDFLEGYDVFMIGADASAGKEYTAWSDWYYEREPFPLLQIVWPDKHGLFPWDDGVSDAVRDCQPVLGERGDAGGG